MGIIVNTSPQQITASVGETQIDVTVSGGIGPSGAVGGGYTLPTATASVLGGVKIGSGISIDGSGVISASAGYTLPTATSSVLGGVKIGSGVTITDGVISVSTNYAAASHSHATSDITGLATALSDINTAISGKAAAADFDQSLKTTDTVAFFRIDLTGSLYGPYIGIASGAVELSEFGVTLGQGAVTYADDSVQTTAWTGKIGTTSGLIVTTGTDGVLGTLAQGTAGQVLKVNSGATGVEWVSLGGAASLNVGTTAGTVAAGDHTHSQLHDRSHSITSTSDHTAGNWKVLYTNGSGQVVELGLGDSGKALISNGASAAPSWGQAGSNSASDLTAGTLSDSRLSTNAQAAINLYLWSAFR